MTRSESSIRFQVAVILLVGVTLGACATGPDTTEERTASVESAPDLLTAVPAETPYLVATPSPVSADRLREYLVINFRLGSTGPEGNRPPFLDVQALVFEFLAASNTGDAGKRGELGLGPRARFACYGLGLYPTCRFPLSSKSEFLEAWSGAESRVGVEAVVETPGGAEVRRYPFSENLEFVVVATANEATAGVVPEGEVEAFVSHARREETPDRSIAGMGEPGRTVDKHDLTGAATAWVDLRRAVEEVYPGSTGDEREGEGNFYESRLAEAVSSRSEEGGDAEACAAEWKRFAGLVERVVFGFRTIESEAVELELGVETNDELTRRLRALGSTPWTYELGRHPGTEYDVELASGLHVDEVTGTLEAAAAHLEEEPFECAGLARVDESIGRWGEKLGASARWVSGLEGVHLRLSEVEVRDRWFRELAGLLTTSFASRKQARRFLLAVNQTESPEIAEDRGAIRLALPGFFDFAKPVVASEVGDTELAVGLGDGAEKRARAVEPPSSDSASDGSVPLLVYGYSEDAPRLPVIPTSSGGDSNTGETRDNSEDEGAKSTTAGGSGGGSETRGGGSPEGGSSEEGESGEGGLPYTFEAGVGTRALPGYTVLGAFATDHGVAVRLGNDVEPARDESGGGESE